MPTCIIRGGPTFCSHYLSVRLTTLRLPVSTTLSDFGHLLFRVTSKLRDMTTTVSVHKNNPIRFRLRFFLDPDDCLFGAVRQILQKKIMFHLIMSDGAFVLAQPLSAGRHMYMIGRKGKDICVSKKNNIFSLVQHRRTGV